MVPAPHINRGSSPTTATDGAADTPFDVPDTARSAHGASAAMPPDPSVGPAVASASPLVTPTNTQPSAFSPPDVAAPPTVSWNVVAGVLQPQQLCPRASPAVSSAQTSVGGLSGHQHHLHAGQHHANTKSDHGHSHHNHQGAKDTTVIVVTRKQSQSPDLQTLPAVGSAGSAGEGAWLPASSTCFAATPHPAAPPGDLGVLPPWVPKKPPRFVNPETRWVPVPHDTGFAGYWEKIPELSSKLPAPISVMLDVSWLARKAHESIKGIKVEDSAKELVVSAKVAMYGAAIVAKEKYTKDGSPSRGLLRRDLRPGTTASAAYFTARNEMVLLVDCYSVTGRLDNSGVEVWAVVEGGQQIRCMQACYCHNSNRSAVQEFVGKLAPPPY